MWVLTIELWLEQLFPPSCVTVGLTSPSLTFPVCEVGIINNNINNIMTSS